MTGALTVFLARTVLRGRWSVVIVIGFAMTAGAVTLLGLSSFRQLGLGAVGPAVVALLNLALLLPAAQAALVAAMAMSTDRETGFFAMIRARGVQPWSLAVGVWATATLASWISLLAGFGVAAVIVAGNVPVEDMVGFGALLGIAMAVSATAAAIGTLIGVVVRTRTQAAFVTLFVWFVLAVGLDLLVVGLAVFLRAGEPGLLAAVLSNPIQAGRTLALIVLDASGGVLGPLGTYLSVHLGRIGSIVLLVGAIGAWAAVPLAAAAVLLGRRGS